MAVPALNPVSVYSWLEAKKAYAQGERSFYVYPKYPLKRQKAEQRSCEACIEFCTLVHFDHRDNGALVLKCRSCNALLEGGLYDVGVRSKVASKDPDRLFDVHAREEIFKRDGVRCWKCGAGPDKDELEADHIIPYVSKGPTHILNGITLCKSCNAAKGTTYDEEFVTSALFYTHRKEFGPYTGGTKDSFSLMRSVANSLKAWGQIIS